MCVGEVLTLVFSDYLKLFGKDLSRESALGSQKRKSPGLFLE